MQRFKKGAREKISIRMGAEGSKRDLECVLKNKAKQLEKTAAILRGSHD